MNEDHKDIKKFFSDLLNANVTIKDSLYPDNKETFLIVVDKLKSIYDSQVSLLHEKGIDLGDITEDFWFVIDNLFIMFYGEEINNLIQWYITSQKNSKGKVTPWIGKDGKSYEFRNSLDLWEYIQYFIYSKDA
jgi:hypothetical protein